MVSHNFKYGSIYRSPAGKLYRYLGSTVSSTNHRSYFQLTFRQVKPAPSPDGRYYDTFKNFSMFHPEEECFGWTYDRAATVLFYEEDKLYFKNRE